MSLLQIALQSCLRDARVHGHPLGNQNTRDLEQNVAAVSAPLPPGVLEEFEAAGL